MTVYISVTDAAGQPVGIDASTIQIFENGELMPTQPIGGGGQGGVGPLTTMLVMDVSGSMDKGGKIDGAKTAAKAYVDQMRSGDQAGLMIYNTRSTYVQELTQDHNVLKSAIDNIQTGGDTAMYDAVFAAEEILRDVQGRKAIIAVTDGLDNSSSRNEDDVVNAIGPSGLSISTIGLGDPSTSEQPGLDEAGLRSLAQRSGGGYSFAGDAASLSALFQMYGRELQSEYALTYTSPSTIRDGVNRNLTVSLGGAGVTVDSKYNPGGVLPEVPNQSWVLFGGLLIGLLALLVIPDADRRRLEAAGRCGQREEARPREAERRVRSIRCAGHTLHGTRASQDQVAQTKRRPGSHGNLAFLFSCSRYALGVDLDLADDHDYFALDLQRVALVDVDRLHRRIGGLEAIAVLLLVEILERGLTAFREPDGDHIAVAGILRGFHDDDVTVVDHGIDHGVPVDLKCEEILALLAGRHEGGGDLHGFVRIEVVEVRAGNQDGLACLDASKDGNAEHLANGGLPGNTKAARDLAITFDMAALLQLVEVVIDDRRGGNAAGFADLTDGRRVLVLALVLLNELQDALVALAQPLAFSDHHHMRLPRLNSLICATNNT